MSENQPDLYIDSLRTVLNTDAGRRVFDRIIGYTNFLGLSFDSDPLKTAFNDGRRSIGLDILADVRIADDTKTSGILLNE